MSFKHLVIVSILGFSSIALADSDKSAADNAKPAAANDQQRMWTIQASENHAAHANDSKTVADPGVFVTAQRDPHDKK